MLMILLSALAACASAGKGVAASASPVGQRATPVAQTELSHEAATIQRQLGEETGFSGVSIGPSVVNVYWKDALPHHATAVIASVAGAHARVHPARYSRCELRAAESSILASRASLRTTGIEVVSVSTPLDGSKLAVKLAAAATPAVTDRVHKIAGLAVAVSAVGGATTT